MKIDTTRITLAGQLAGNIPSGAEVLGLVLEPVDRLHSALVRIPSTGIYVTMCGDVCRSVDQREAQRAVDAAYVRSRYNAAELARLGYGDTGGDVVELHAVEVMELARCVGGTVDEIESCRIGMKDEPGATLYDSDTTEPLTAKGLGITTAEYTALVNESLQCTETEGHVKTDSGRRVYAD